MAAAASPTGISVWSAEDMHTHEGKYADLAPFPPKYTPVARTAIKSAKRGELLHSRSVLNGCFKRVYVCVCVCWVEQDTRNSGRSLQGNIWAISPSSRKLSISEGCKFDLVESGDVERAVGSLDILYYHLAPEHISIIS